MPTFRWQRRDVGKDRPVCPDRLETLPSFDAWHALLLDIEPNERRAVRSRQSWLITRVPAGLAGIGASFELSTSLSTRVPLRTPVEEIGDQLQSERLALFRMELGARDIVDTDHRRHRPAMVRRRNHGAGMGRPEME